MTRFERHEVDAGSVEAKPEPKQRDEEGRGDDEPAVVKAPFTRSLNDEPTVHGLEHYHFTGRALAVIGPHPTTESDFSYRGGMFRCRLGFHDYGTAARA